MNNCALCGSAIEVEKNFSRTSACPACNGDLHICLNCRFYSKSSHNKCIEPKSEYQRIRDRANFCDYFQFKKGERQGPGPSGNDKDEAKRKLDELFGG